MEQMTTMIGTETTTFLKNFLLLFSALSILGGILYKAYIKPDTHKIVSAKVADEVKDLDKVFYDKEKGVRLEESFKHLDKKIDAQGKHTQHNFDKLFGKLDNLK